MTQAKNCLRIKASTRRPCVSRAIQGHTDPERFPLAGTGALHCLESGACSDRYAAPKNGGGAAIAQRLDTMRAMFD